MPRTVAVIGAGASGLCSARHMLAAGFDVTVFEIGSHIGGLWVYLNDNNRSSAYKTLHINTARDLTAFEDFPFDRDVQPFPDHRDMRKYLNDYARHFGITERIRFNTEVTNIRPADDYRADRPRWTITTRGGETIDFDIVMLATGHLTRPLEVPQFKDGFTGEYLHSHHYKDPARFAGKRVCVVGVGNSGLDIASDICTTAECCYLVGRTTPLIIPKLIFGKPFWDTMKPFYKPWVPAAVRMRVLKFLVWVVHGSMADLGFGKQKKKIHASSNANIVNHIRYRRVTVKPDITRIDGQRITFPDGTSQEFDALIAATGYLIDLDVLADGIVRRTDHSLDLYMRIVPPAWRGIYFMGFFNSDSALNWICNGQAKWVAEHETGLAALPDEAAMEAEIAARKRWIETTYENTPRHGIEVEHLPYFADLAKSLKENRNRAATRPLPASPSSVAPPPRGPGPTAAPKASARTLERA